MKLYTVRKLLFKKTIIGLKSMSFITLSNITKLVAQFPVLIIVCLQSNESVVLRWRCVGLIIHSGFRLN